MSSRTIWIAAGAVLIMLVVLRLSLDDAAAVSSPRPQVASAPAVHPRGLADRPHARIGGPRLGPGEVLHAPRPLDEVRARAARRVVAQTELLERTLAADRADPRWSPQAEQALRDAFAAAAVPGARLAELACGARLCRYMVAFGSIEQRDDGITAVTGLIPWRSKGFGDISAADPQHYVFYVSRDPDSFPTVD